MTDNVKVISRPKVRFCQFSDNGRNKEEVVQHCKEQAVLQANGPRIKEIVSPKLPIKVVDSMESTNVGSKDVSLSNCNVDTSAHYSTTPGNIRNESSSDINMPKVERMTVLRDANGIPNTKESCTKLSQLDKDPQDNILKDLTKSMQEKGKENKGLPLKGATSNKNISDTRIGNSQHRHSVRREKFKLSTDNNYAQKVNVTGFKKPKMTKSQSVPSIMKKTRNPMICEKILNAKLVTPDVTSHSKTVAKNKIFPVKKIILRNASGPKIKTSVGPGIFRKKQNDAKASDANERSMVTLGVTIKDLTQPEYNSIMCTVNKLKELEQQKIITDVNHLPSALKSFLNGKISAALDFPLDEAIYKNLVDLSIDEKQLPSTITRSKDPEPRQKDIVPKLSDFFIPEDTKEICEAVHVKSRASKIDDDWNAFKISDRILEWKYSIDDID